MKKNSEIHEGLDQSEVRNFLAHQLAEAWGTNAQPKSLDLSPDSDPLDWAIQSAKNMKDLSERQIKNLEHKKAVLILIEKMGWEEFDVSEMTTKDMAWWWSFIGTKEEYQNQFIAEDEKDA